MSDENKVVEKKVFSEEEIQAALEIVHQEYYMNVISLLSHNPKIKDLTYVRVPVVTPQGGTYLVSILHVDGPKLDLQKLAEAAEAQEKKS